jgi:hypothetical protein
VTSKLLGISLIYITTPDHRVVADNIAVLYR